MLIDPKVHGSRIDGERVLLCDPVWRSSMLGGLGVVAVWNEERGTWRAYAGTVNPTGHPYEWTSEKLRTVTRDDARVLAGYGAKLTEHEGRAFFPQLDHLPYQNAP